MLLRATLCDDSCPHPHPLASEYRLSVARHRTGQHQCATSSGTVMRGFGHIKEKNVKAAKEREASLLAAYRNPATQSVAAE